jgi:TATA-box binding protein (TBP) (component of TFIID and TFIIIB)
MLTYTPETFPGVNVSVRGSLVAIVFYTGKIILTGARNEDDIRFAEQYILSMIDQLVK